MRRGGALSEDCQSQDGMSKRARGSTEWPASHVRRADETLFSVQTESPPAHPSPASRSHRAMSHQLLASMRRGVPRIGTSMVVARPPRTHHLACSLFHEPRRFFANRFPRRSTAPAATTPSRATAVATTSSNSLTTASLGASTTITGGEAQIANVRLSPQVGIKVRFPFRQIHAHLCSRASSLLSVFRARASPAGWLTPDGIESNSDPACARRSLPVCSSVR